MHTMYLVHIYIKLPLHVSTYLTPSSGRTYVFFSQKICFDKDIVSVILVAS